MARILIAGGSLGGLFAANLLWRDGHDVQVLEKVRGSMSGRGAGIVTHDALAQALQRAGVGSDVPLGVEVPGRVLLNPDGSTHTRLDMPQVLTSWSRLYELLRRAFPNDRYHPGVSVTQVQAQGDGVVLHTLVDGEPQPWQGELLLACDGIRSSVRQQLWPAVQPRYAGYVAWRGVCDEAMLSRHTLDTLFPYFGFCVPECAPKPVAARQAPRGGMSKVAKRHLLMHAPKPVAARQAPRGGMSKVAKRHLLMREQIIGYPVAGADLDTTPGRRAYNFVWYRPAAEGAALRSLMSDADGQHHPLGLPPHKVSWRHIARTRQDACDFLAPQWAEVVHKTALPFMQPIYDLASSTVHHGRVALLGDAAYVARPHIGMGVTKAAADAVALCDAVRLHGASATALAAYAAVRQPHGAAAVARARWLGAYLEGRGEAHSAARLHQAISETAIDLGRYGHLSAFTPTPDG